MSFFSCIYRNGLWISVPLFIMSVALLVYLIRDVIKVMKQVRLTGVPLVEEQEVEFAEAGQVVLCMEGPRFTTRFANLSYRLIGPDGSPAKSRCRAILHVLSENVGERLDGQQPGIFAHFGEVLARDAG